MSLPTGERAMALRIAVLGGVTLLALVSVAEWSLPSLESLRGGDRLELVIAAFDRGTGTVVDDVLPPRAGELRFAGTVSKACHLFAFAMTPFGPRRLGLAKDDAPGVPVGPGEFRLPGDYAFEFTPGRPLRIWAVCGPADLRYADLVTDARTQVEEAGSGAEGLTRADRLQQRPASALQATRLLRWAF